MKNILILGAGGAIAKHTIEDLQKDGDFKITLFARHTDSISKYQNAGTSVLKGDVLNEDDLNNAMANKDIVYANLSGSVDKMAELIVKAMKQNNVKRLIFITSLGIYDEIPGKFGVWNRQMIGSDLVRYRRAADVIEASGLDYTIVRPAWLQDEDEVSFETTQKSEPFKGTEVSRKSVGVYVADIIRNPEKDSRASLGINMPGTDADKPSFY